MMEFKHCKHYEQAIEQEHCAFECVCMDDCYFTRVSQDNIEKHIEEYEEYMDKCREVNVLESDIGDLQDELYEYEKDINALEIENKELINVIAQLIKDNKVENIEKYIGELNNITRNDIELKCNI